MKKGQSYGICVGDVLIEKSSSGKIWLWSVTGDGMEIRGETMEKLEKILEMFMREEER